MHFSLNYYTIDCNRGIAVWLHRAAHSTDYIEIIVHTRLAMSKPNAFQAIRIYQFTKKPFRTTHGGRKHTIFIYLKSPA